MKEIFFTAHARDQMADRGATEDEVNLAIRHGEHAEAKNGRLVCRKNFNFDRVWKGKHYRYKQVMPVIREEALRTVVITVYVFYFGGE